MERLNSGFFPFFILSQYNGEVNSDVLWVISRFIWRLSKEAIKNGKLVHRQFDGSNSWWRFVMAVKPMWIEKWRDILFLVWISRLCTSNVYRPTRHLWYRCRWFTLSTVIVRCNIHLASIIFMSYRAIFIVLGWKHNSLHIHNMYRATNKDYDSCFGIDKVSRRLGSGWFARILLFFHTLPSYVAALKFHTYINLV